MTKVFTHIGTLGGDARTGGRQFRAKLRLTPSGSHWVDIRGRKYPKGGGGYVGDKWPMYFLDAGSILELPASAMSTGTAKTPKAVEGQASAVAKRDAQ